MSYFFMKICWYSTSDICWYSVCHICWYSIRHICWYSINHICWYNIHNMCNFITQIFWINSNSFSMLTIFNDTCTRIPAIIFYPRTIVFRIILTCFIIPFFIWIKSLQLQLNLHLKYQKMFYHYLSLIFVYYHI